MHDLFKDEQRAVAIRRLRDYGFDVDTYLERLGQARSVTGRAQGTATTDFFARENKTPEGWHLPLVGNAISYRYVGLLDFAFEVWLGGDNDLTVRLGRPFTYGLGDSATSYDPRSTRKSVMGRLLGLGDLDVAEFLVKRVGELEINFSDNSRLVAGPADDGQALCAVWTSRTLAANRPIAARPATRRRRGSTASGPPASAPWPCWRRSARAWRPNASRQPS